MQNNKIISKSFCNQKKYEDTKRVIRSHKSKKEYGQKKKKRQKDKQ